MTQHRDDTRTPQDSQVPGGGDTPQTGPDAQDRQGRAEQERVEQSRRDHARSDPDPQHRHEQDRNPQDRRG